MVFTIQGTIRHVGSALHASVFRSKTTHVIRLHATWINAFYVKTIVDFVLLTASRIGAFVILSDTSHRINLFAVRTLHVPLSKERSSYRECTTNLLNKTVCSIILGLDGSCVGTGRIMICR
jgi:hypothetical protein